MTPFERRRYFNPGSTWNDHAGSVTGGGSFVPGHPDGHPLDAARGVLLAVVLGAAFWAAILFAPDLISLF